MTKSEIQNLIANSPVLRRFLNFIGKAEGADYNIGFGGRKINDLSQHPYRPREFRTVDGTPTSAAGKYQFVRGTWDNLKRKLGLDSFSPANQDVGAVELIIEKNALGDVLSGNTGSAIQKLMPIWESFKKRSYYDLQRLYANSTSDLQTYTSGADFGSGGFGSVLTQPMADASFDFSKFIGVKIMSDTTRYMIAFAILIVILVFAFSR